MIANNMMYFWRVIFTYLIAIHHLRNAFACGVGWYIGVDFFAIMSGYLICEHVKKNQEESSFQYIKSRFKYFVPVVFISAMIRLSVDSYYLGTPLKKCFETILDHIPEFLLINTYGLSGFINSVDWYIQALFVVSILAIYLLKKHKEFTLNVLAPIAPILIFSLLFKQYSNLEGYMLSGKTIDGLLNWDLLRVMGGVSLGIMANNIVQNVELKSSLKNNIISFSLLSLVIYFSSIYGHTKYDLLYLIMMFVAAIFGFSSQAHKIFYNKFIVFLSNISILIYLNHYAFRTILRHIYQDFSISLIIVYVLCITIFSAILYLLLSKYFKNMKKER